MGLDGRMAGWMDMETKLLCRVRRRPLDLLCVVRVDISADCVNCQLWSLNKCILVWQNVHVGGILIMIMRASFCFNAKAPGVPDVL